MIRDTARRIRQDPGLILEELHKAEEHNQTAVDINMIIKIGRKPLKSYSVSDILSHFLRLSNKSIWLMVLKAA